MAIIVALLDVDPVRGARVARALNRSSGFHCTGLFKTLPEAMHAFRHSTPDIALVDETFIESTGFDQLARLKAILPSLEIVVLHDPPVTDRLVEAIVWGVSGCVEKSASMAELFRALEEVLRGGSPLGGQIARKLIECVQHRATTSASTDLLSFREREILVYLVRGYPYKQIADALALSIDTVRTYVRRLYAKLNVRSRAHAILKCQSPLFAAAERDRCLSPILPKQTGHRRAVPAMG